MQILHFADLHLGMENYGRMDHARGLHTRTLDFLRSFDFIIETAISRQVDLVLFCGDAFRTREPSPTLQCLFAERINRLAKAQIPVLLLMGNHDLPPVPGRRSALEIYPILEVPGVEVVTTPGLRTVETRSGPLQVACLPAGIDSGTTQSAEAAHRAAQLVAEMARQTTGDSPAVFAGHVSIEGARVGTEGVLAIGRELTLRREALLHPQFCYIALGHAHRFQDLNPGQQPPLVYCGSPERVDFSEAEEPKGFVMVEIDDSTRYEFIETPARRFVTIDLELKPEDGTAEVLEAINAQPTEDAVVKVILRSQEDAAVDEKEIRRALDGAHFVTPVSREIENPPARLRAPELAQGWENPLSALEEYLKTTRLSEERKKRLRAAAAELARGNSKEE